MIIRHSDNGRKETSAEGSTARRKRVSRRRLFVSSYRKPVAMVEAVYLPLHPSRGSHSVCTDGDIGDIARNRASFHLSTAAVMMILGVDALIDMGRTALNVVGNCLASAVVGRWESLTND